MIFLSILGNFVQAGEAAVAKKIGEVLASKKPALEPKVLETIQRVLYDNIGKFKLGSIDEKEFDETICTLLHKNGIEMTVSDLNKHWSVIYPQGEAFQKKHLPFIRALLDSAKKGTGIDLISFTNPKDMAILKRELESKENELKMSEEKDHFEIRGSGNAAIHIFPTYLAKQPLPQVLASVVNSHSSQKMTFINKKDIKINTDMQQILINGKVPVVEWDGTIESLTKLLEVPVSVQSLVQFGITPNSASTTAVSSANTASSFSCSTSGHTPS